MSRSASGNERILIVNVFDALTSVRPHKKAWTIKVSVAMIKENSGKHFDPSLFELFVQELPGIVAIRKRFSEKSET